MGDGFLETGRLFPVTGREFYDVIVEGSEDTIFGSGANGVTSGEGSERRRDDRLHKEADVIRLMRKNLKASSFRRWHQRVSGRLTKHAGKFQESRQELKKVTTRSLLEKDE